MAPADVQKNDLKELTTKFDALQRNKFVPFRFIFIYMVQQWNYK